MYIPCETDSHCGSSSEQSAQIIEGVGGSSSSSGTGRMAESYYSYDPEISTSSIFEMDSGALTTRRLYQYETKIHRCFKVT